MSSSIDMPCGGHRLCLSRLSRQAWHSTGAAKLKAAKSPRDTEVRSGARALRIMEMFAKERRPLSAGEIASRLEIPQTSAHRLLATLVSMRWAERKAGRLYQMG